MKSLSVYYVVFSFLLLTSLQVASQERQYKKTLKKGTVEEYENFLKKYPSSAYTDEINGRYEELLFKRRDYKKLLRKFPNTIHLNEALTGIYQSCIKDNGIENGIVAFLALNEIKSQSKDTAFLIVKQKTDKLDDLKTLASLSNQKGIPENLRLFYAEKLENIAILEDLTDTTYLFSTLNKNPNANCKIAITGRAIIDKNTPYSIEISPNSFDYLELKKGSNLILSTAKNIKVVAENDLTFESFVKPTYSGYMYNPPTKITKNGSYEIAVGLVPIIKYKSDFRNDTTLILTGRSSFVEISKTDDRIQTNRQTFGSINENLIEITDGLITLPSDEYFWIFKNIGIKDGGLFIKDQIFYLLPGTQRISQKK
jgi:hypothetical protein